MADEETGFFAAEEQILDAARTHRIVTQSYCHVAHRVPFAARVRIDKARVLQPIDPAQLLEIEIGGHQLCVPGIDENDIFGERVERVLLADLLVELFPVHQLRRQRDHGEAVLVQLLLEFRAERALFKLAGAAEGTRHAVWPLAADVTQTSSFG